MPDPKTFWEDIYKIKPSKEVSWYSPHLDKSIELILGIGLSKSIAIIDVGGGASTLPDDLLGEGFQNLTILDISAQALKVSQDRLSDRARQVTWFEADITEAHLESNYYDVWHDRAVFHFLTKLEDRKKYIKNLTSSLKIGGYAIFATFGPKGPLKCSGLEIVRYSEQSLWAELGENFRLEKHVLDAHNTPFGTTQEFLYTLFRKS